MRYYLQVKTGSNSMQCCWLLPAAKRTVFHTRRPFPTANWTESETIYALFTPFTKAVILHCIFDGLVMHENFRKLVYKSELVKIAKFHSDCAQVKVPLIDTKFGGLIDLISKNIFPFLGNFSSAILYGVRQLSRLRRFLASAKLWLLSLVGLFYLKVI